MQRLLIAIYIFSSYSFYAQEDYSSFYFKTSQPENTASIFTIDDSFIGSYYKKDDSLVRVVVDKDSIYTEFGILFILSPKEVNKNKTLSIKDSLLFGIQPNKGIPFTTIEDTIYAVLVQQDLLFKPDSNHILKFDNGVYFLNSRNSNNLFTTKLLTLEKDTLILKETDHLKTFSLLEKFKRFSESEQNGIKTYIANPTQKELNLFIKEDGFNDLLKYHL